MLDRLTALVPEYSSGCVYSKKGVTKGFWVSWDRALFRDRWACSKIAERVGGWRGGECPRMLSALLRKGMHMWNPSQLESQLAKLSPSLPASVVCSKVKEVTLRRESPLDQVSGEGGFKGSGGTAVQTCR